MKLAAGVFSWVTVALVVAISLGGCGGSLPASAPPTPSSACALLGEDEIAAALPTIKLEDPGHEETTGGLRSCRWDGLLLSQGPYQALIDQTGDDYASTGDTRTIEGLGSDAIGDQNPVRVVIYVKTDRGAFSLTASANQGVTIDTLLPLARLVASRL